MNEIRIDVTQAELDDIRQSEAVCLYIMEKPDGSLYAIVGRHGDHSEMQQLAETHEMLIHFDGTPKCVSKDCVYVRDIFGQQESN